MSATPGPWYAEGRGGLRMDGTSDGYRITSLDVACVASLYPHGSPDRHQRRADASLIAAAPDMLQLLKDINDASWQINSKTGQRIRELIARAEGKTE